MCILEPSVDFITVHKWLVFFEYFFMRRPSVCCLVSLTLLMRLWCSISEIYIYVDIYSTGEIEGITVELYVTHWLHHQTQPKRFNQKNNLKFSTGIPFMMYVSRLVGLRPNFRISQGITRANLSECASNL